MKKKPTSFDVAKLAGVHRSAVSRAFSDNGSISQETKLKVIKAADQLGYRVNYLARGLQNNDSGLVGIVASRLDTPYRAEQVRIIARELINNGLMPLLITAETQADVKNLMSKMLNYNVAGMIITSDTPPSEIVDECQRLAVPLVLVNRDVKIGEADRVQLDVQAAGQMAFDMLYACGARRFCVLKPADRTYTVAGRARAFVAICEAKGLDVDLRQSQSQNYEAGLLAADRMAQDIEQFDGVFCATDLLALGLLDGLRHRHACSIPDDIQLLGFDDITQSAWLGNRLSTIKQDVERSGVLAVELIVGRLEHPDRPVTTVSVPLEPIYRQTTKKRAL